MHNGFWIPNFTLYPFLWEEDVSFELIGLLVFIVRADLSRLECMSTELMYDSPEVQRLWAACNWYRGRIEERLQL